MTPTDIPSRLSKVRENLEAASLMSPRGGNLANQTALPKPLQVKRIVRDLKNLLFPGFWHDETSELDRGTATQADGHLADVFARLTSLMSRAFEASSDRKIPEGKTVDEFSAETTIDFLERLPEVRHVLATDAIAAFNGDPACQTIDEAILCYPGIQAISIHRMAHELYKMAVPFIPRMMAEVAHVQTGIDIHPGAQIGDFFFVDHGTGVVIGETTCIGSHVKIYQGVTLGALSFPTNADGSLIRDVKRHPNIEDNVIIYANATVLGGNTTIGHDSVIGSNVWITSSVQPHTTVVMEKPKLRMRNELEDELISSLNYQI